MALKTPKKETKKQVLRRKLRQKMLKPKAIFELTAEVKQKERCLANLIIDCIPDSLPVTFIPSLKSIVENWLVSGKCFSLDYDIRDFGFRNMRHFVQQIILLRKAWKKVIVINLSKHPVLPAFKAILNFSPL